MSMPLDAASTLPGQLTPDVIPHVDKWEPQPGSQVLFLMLRKRVYELLYEGTRGPGKTDCLLMDFAQDVKRGWGREWRGVLFRQTYPQLQDVINKTQKWFKLFHPEARYNKAEHVWEWPTGEALLLRHMKDPNDYWSYHGHAYPWIGWEELTNWPDDKCYSVMMSCSRSTVPGMPVRVRSTTNPYGVGHNWVKARFRLPRMRNSVIRDSYVDGKLEPARGSVHGHITENVILLDADPEYIDRIASAARNPSERRAWLDGSWDILAGGMFDDVFSYDVHVLPNFPWEAIPRGWRLDRSFDWGSSKPFSVAWWAESNGEPFMWEGRKIGSVKGDLVRVAEWYGWNGTRNEGVRMLAEDIAQGILDREDDWGVSGLIKPGPADSSIFDVENGQGVAKSMAKVGVKWEAADKRPGSRKLGWEAVRQMMKNAQPHARGEPREGPGLFVTERCDQWLETVPVLPRDEKDLDDVDTDAEDHAGDETRYRVRRRRRELGRRRMRQ